MQFTVLGTAQDGGIPRQDCSCSQCQKGVFRHGPAALVEAGSSRYLIDTPPDINRMVGLTTVDAIILTHTHIGHYGGLFFLGKESCNTNQLPVRCSQKVGEWLQSGNKAYSHLVSRGNIVVQSFTPDEVIQLQDSIQCTPISVTHRNEDGDTVAIRLDGNNTSVLYMTDIDYWTEKAVRAVRDVDVAFVDGTFYSKTELGSDRIEDVPHPPIPETIEEFSDSDTMVYFTHLNHTNPVADTDSDEYAYVTGLDGFDVADDGTTISF